MKLFWLNAIILMLVGIVKTTPLMSSNSVNCDTQTEFDCELGTRRCIPKGWLCDGITDCDNWNDELYCPVSSICVEGEYQCKGENKCIHNSFVCDGDRDCANNSDEEDCYQDSANNTTSTEAPTTSTQNEPDSGTRLATFSCLFVAIFKFF